MVASLQRAELWHAQSGQLRRLNRVPQAVEARAGGGGLGFTAAETPTVWNALFPVDARNPNSVTQSLVPNASVGLLSGANWESELTEWNSPSTTTVTIPDGTSLQNKIIYGDAAAGARVTNVEFSNCLFRGGSHVPASDYACIYLDSTANSGGAAKWRLWDCEIWPQRPSLKRDGMRGNRFEAYRTVVRDCIDAFGPFSAGVNSGNANVKLMGCITERFYYFYPDADHSDGTHNDGVQVHGGKAVEAWGCFFNGTSWRPATSGTNPDYPWRIVPIVTDPDTYPDSSLGWANGSSVIVNNSTGAPDNTVYFHHNWLRGSVMAANLKPGITGRFENNRVFHESGWQGSQFQFFVRLERQTSVPNYGVWTGINPAGNTVVVNIGNVWADAPNAGQLLDASGTTTGIYFNP